MVDATSMDSVSIAEMVADWTVVSEELGNSSVDWADSTVNVRWKFSARQRRLIYGLLYSVWSNGSDGVGSYK